MNKTPKEKAKKLPNSIYNSEFCFGYLKREWELQEPKIKKIFGHNDAATIEQYVNGLIDMVLNPNDYKKL